MARVVEIIIKGKDQMSESLKGIGGGLGQLQSGLLSVGAVGVGAIGAVGAVLGKLAMDAAEGEALEHSFENLAESIGTTSDVILDELAPATANLLNNDELALVSVKLLTSGLADNKDEMAEIAGTAVRLGRAVGMEAMPSVESFTNMLMTGSTRALKEFGISEEEVTTRAKELKDANAGMTDQQAFLQAALDVSQEKLALMGDEAGTLAADKMEALRTKFENVEDELGEALLPAFGILLDELIIPLADAILDDLAPALAETLPGAIKATTDALQGIAGRISGILEGIKALDEWTAAHLAPPEARGYLGRAEAGAYAGSYMGQSEGGRWSQRVEINVNGMPELANYLTANAVMQAERHSMGSIGG